MITIFDVLGLVGVALILITYFLLQIEMLKIEKALYSVLNLFGSILIFIFRAHSRFSVSIAAICPNGRPGN